MVNYLVLELGGGLRRGVAGLEQLHQGMDLRALGGRHPEYPSVGAFQRSVQRRLDVASTPVHSRRRWQAALLRRHGPHRSPAPAPVPRGEQ